MDTIATITLNPALDKSAVIKKLIPDKKLRADHIRHEPGGGGINVSRAIHKLGGRSVALYARGGHSGDYFEQLLAEEGVEQRAVQVNGITRENFMIVEESTDQRFRFGMKGARLTGEEAQACLDLLRHVDPKPSVVVASGSLPPGLPPDFYGEVARVAGEIGAKFILDTSGEALKKGVKHGVFLLKPNLGELSSLANVESVEMDMVEQLARQLIEEGKSEIVTVSLGAGGALLITSEMSEHIPAPTVRKKSVVGAGDSMVAGMALSIAQGRSLREMVRFGVATGTAATMTPASELCRKGDAENLYRWILKNAPVD